MWLDVTGLTPHKRLAIPLKPGSDISGTIRLVLNGSSARGRGRGRTARGGKLEIHHAVPEAKACVTRPCGSREIGVDKGYTEVFTDSDGQRHGLGLGAMLTTKTDANRVRYGGRQTLAALADKSSERYFKSIAPPKEWPTSAISPRSPDKLAAIAFADGLYAGESSSGIFG
jgi:hypothetical protein